MTRPLTPASQNDDIHSLSTTQPLEPFLPALFDDLFQRVANKIKYVQDNSSGGAPSFASITGKPTTLAGYGITDGVTDAELAANSSVISVAPGYTGTTTQRSTSFVSSNGAPTISF
jgi:hypothetical protein